MIIKNVRIFQEDGTFQEGELYTFGDSISTSSEDEQILDGKGAWAIPGLTDIHFHGCMGYDFCDGTAEAFAAMAAYELKHGITQICPATMTLGEDTLLNVAKTARAFADAQGSLEPTRAHENVLGQTASDPLPVSKSVMNQPQAVLAGINMEGPFVSHAKKGAQNPLYLKKPDIAMVQRLQEASGGLFKLVAIAPEEEGAMEFIEALKDQVVLSLAHTTADYDTAMEAFAKGASHVTHLYNAMPPFTHRAPGVVGAACDTKDCYAELICDGIHIHPSMVRATFRMFGDERIVLISDSMMATGLSDGDYSLGGLEVKVQGPLATLADGTLAGSATNLMDCLRRAVKDMGIPLGSAVKCAAVNSAKSIGIYDRYGSLVPGKAANIVLLDEELEIQQMVFQGKLLF